MKNTFASLAIAAALAAAVAAAATPPVASARKTTDIVVDGDIKKWPVLTPLGDGISVAAVNDADNLYLAIVTSDTDRLRQIGTGGVVVWFDPGGGTKEAFGIRVPPTGAPRPGDRFAGTGDDTPSRERPQPKVTWVEIDGPGKNDARRIELAAEDVIAVAAGMNEGTLLVELRVPIGKGPAEFPYGIGTTLERRLGLGIEAAKAADSQSQAGSSAGRGGSGGFGGRGGRGGRGGYGGGNSGMTRGGSGSQTKALKVWTTLTLAKS
jgi:hypothetical protein